MARFLTSLLVILTLSGCQPSGDKVETETTASAHTEWSYTGESSPEHWAELEVGSACGGQHQSPIDIIDLETEPSHLSRGIVAMEYQPLTTIEAIVNNGHTIEYDFDADDNYLILRGKRYRLKQFHFHSPSEHTFNGRRYPLEIHMVHHSADAGSYVVFSLLAEQGPPDPAFDFLEGFLPVEKGETKAIHADYDFGSRIRESLESDTWNIYTYEGSLTTPPCTENVLWMIRKAPIHASAKQIALLKQLMPINNYRETQPLYGRTVYHETIRKGF